MTKIAFLPFLFLVIFSCKNSTGNDASNATGAATDSANFTTVQWLDSAQNIGTLEFGQKSEIKFHFKNSGNKPLYIISATPGCGCTVADFPKGAIAPGDGGEIVAAFDTNKSHPGHFNKSISVKTNSLGYEALLSFEGEIKEAPKKEKKPDTL